MLLKHPQFWTIVNEISVLIKTASSMLWLLRGHKIINELNCDKRTKRESSDGIVATEKTKNYFSISGRGMKFFSSQNRPDLLWGPHSLLCVGMRNSFLGGNAARLVKLNTHFCLMLRLRISRAILPLLHMQFCFALGQDSLHIMGKKISRSY